MTSSIELVIFDMDGVLAHLDYARRLRNVAMQSGCPESRIQQEIYESDFERSAEAGAFPTGEEYLDEYNRRIGATLTRAQWIAARRDAMTPIAETFAIARRLQPLVTLATLTNNGSLLKESIADILPAAAEIFGASFHSSYEFGARKPNPAVFERIVSRYRAAPNRTLFIDDQLDYLAGATAAGLRTIHFTSAKQLEASLIHWIPQLASSRL